MKKRSPELSTYIFLPFRVIYKIYYLFFFVISLALIYPLLFYFLYKPGRFRGAFNVMRGYAFCLLFFAGARLKVKGSENIPKEGAFIICPNHSSFLDIFCVYRVFKRYFVFTGKKEIEKWPLFRIFYTSGMNILVDRKSKTGDIKALRRMVVEIDKGNPLVIFPEGTISKEAPKLAPFKLGAFVLAVQKQISVLPVTFLTNWRLMQRGDFWFGRAGPGIAEIIIHEPVSTKGLSRDQAHEMQDLVKAVINKPLAQYQAKEKSGRD